MSSLLKISRIPNIINKCKYFGFTTLKNYKYTGKPLAGLSACSSSTNKIRTYAVQIPQENLEVSDKVKPGFNLDAEFIFVDSILRRGHFLRKKTIEELHRKVRVSKDVTSTQTLFLLRCCGSNANLETNDTRNQLVSKIWNTYQEKGIPLDISHYNALLQVFLENEHKFSPLDFLATIEAKGIEPNRITYSRLIARFCQEGDIEGANKILEFLKEKKLPINEYIFNSLVLGNSRANDLEGARNIIEVMKQSEIMPSSETYGALLQAFAEHKDVDSIKDLIAQSQQEDISISAKSLMDVIYILAEKDFTQHIDEILTKIEARAGHSSLLTQTISRLLQSGHDEIAFRIYKTLPFNEEMSHKWSFFPKMLAASDLDLHKIVKYCDELKSNGWNILSFELALESFLNEDKFDLALGLLRVMKERGIAIKEHYFYPLVCHSGQGNDREKSLEIFEEMVQMEVNFSTEFISTFLLPALNISEDIKDLEAVYMRLLNYQGEVDFASVYNGMIEYLLRNSDLDLAAEFVRKFRRGIRWSLRAFLADLFFHTNNAKAVACLLRQMLPISVRLNRADANELNENDHLGIKEFMMTVINSIKRKGSMNDQFMNLLNAMEEEGVMLTSATVNEVISRIGSDLTTEMEQVLHRLSNLTPQQIWDMKPSSGNFNRQVANDHSLRQKIEEAKASGGEVSPELRIALVTSLIRQRKVSEVEEMLSTLKSDGIALPPLVQVVLFDMYLEVEKLKEAEDVLSNLTDESPAFQISGSKVIKYAALLAKQDRIEDVAKCLLINSPEDGEWTSETKPNLDDFIHRRRIRHLLSSVAEKKDLPTLKLIQEALISRKFGQTPIVLPSLVQYYLDEGNLEEAMSTFEKLFEEYNITAGKENLTIACINKEDTQKIQRIIDISSKIHGDMNTLYDLTFSFIDLGKLKQAERVLQTSGLRTLHMRLNDRCEMYLRTERFAQLEGLVSVTKGLFNVDRQKLYSYLLQGMISMDDPEKALGVWTTMQEEGVDPDSKFLWRLGNYLRSKGVEVPFVMPAAAPLVTLATPNRAKAKVRADIHQELETALDSQDMARIEDTWQRGSASDTPFSSALHSRYISTLLRHDKLEEALSIVKPLLVQNKLPSSTVMKLLLQKVALKGDVATVQFLEKYMDEKMKRSCYYSYHLGSSHINSGRTEEFLTGAIETLESPSEGDIASDNRLSLGFFRKIIDEQPQFNSLLKKYSEASSEKGDMYYSAVMWDMHFSKGETTEAEEIYEKYMKNLDNFSVSVTCRSSFHSKDTQKINDLIEILDRKPEGREKIKGFVFSTHIDILNREGKHESALKVLQDSLKSIKLEHYRKISLIAMEKAFTKNSLTFPYDLSTLNQRNESSSSSSSSSSDEAKPQK